MSYKITQADLDLFANKGVKLEINSTIATVNSVVGNGAVLEFKPSSSNVQILSVSLSWYDPMSGDDYVINLVQNGGNFSYTIKSFAIPNDYSYWSINTSIVEATNVVIDQQTIDYIVSKNCTMLINDTPIEIGNIIIDGDILKIIANSGYIFAGGVALQYQDPMTGDMYYQHFTLNSENNIATYGYVYDEHYGTSLEWHILLETVQSAPDVSGSNRVYLIDKNILSKVNSNRIVGNESQGIFDYGEYILSVLELPFEIDESLILNKENIYLGTHNTNASANVLATDKITLDLGMITVDSTENNLLDYANTVAILHLPKTDSITLDINYVIGHSISIEYVIDAYSGSATINISSDKTNNVIKTIVSDLGVNIPYAKEFGNPLLSNADVSVGRNNRLTRPYIEIVRNNSIGVDGLFTIPIEDNGLIEGAGFYTVNNINLVSCATNSEKQSIMEILRNGVIIK